MAVIEHPRRAAGSEPIRYAAFGPLAGVLLGIAVNHGHPGPSAFFAFVALIAVCSLLVWLTRAAEPWRLWEATARVAAVLIGGSALFVLPRSLALAADGGFWQPSVLLRFAIYCIPYPLVAWLIGPRRTASYIAWGALGAIALAWPITVTGMQALTAQQVRRAVGGPPAMYLAIAAPPGHPANGYLRSGQVLWLSYDAAGGPGASGMDYDPDDLDMYVFKADQASPCIVTGPLMQQAVGISFPEASQCTRLAPNLWTIPGAPEAGAVTDVELYKGYFVALSVDSASAEPLSPSVLPELLASVHQASDSEIAGIGQYTYW